MKNNNRNNNNNYQQTTTTEPGLFILQEMLGYFYAAGLRVAAQIKVADHMADGPKTVEQLAKETGTDSAKLYRVLRLLAARGVFHEDEQCPGRFELTPPAQFLRSDVEKSLRHAVLTFTDETIWRPAGELVHSLHGMPPFKRIFGMPFFDYWSQPGVPSDGFHVGMSSMTEVENDFLVRSYDFPNGATVVDVAGGMGALLLRVLQKNGTLHGILFDRKHVLDRNVLGELGDNKKWELASGDFFKSCPKGDFYLLKYIMHDWEDGQAVKILRNIRKEITANGRVLIIDHVLPEGNKPHGGKMMDLLMMAMYEGGRERTEKEFRRLLNEADMKLNKVIDTGSYLSIVEAAPK